MYPSDRKYTADHCWVRIEGSRATVGVTQHLTQALCPIVHVELPAAGHSLESRQACGEIESQKAVTELVSPLSGRVTGINNDLIKQPESLCADPHVIWLIRFELTNANQVAQLLTNVEYERLLETPAPAQPAAKSQPKPAPKAASPPKPEAKPQPKAPAAATSSPSPPAPKATDANELAVQSWIKRLRGTSLSHNDAAFDRDYSGGSTFSSSERVITLHADQRFLWKETTSSRVSSGGLSLSSPPSRKTYQGKWNVTVAGRIAWLVLDDARGRRRYKLKESGRGTLLLDDQAYSWTG
ncbi:MAG: hypothetical protein ABW318_08425 [Vicinamibacterales bacterium]